MERANFLERFPLLSLQKGSGQTFEEVTISGIKETLSGRSSRTSPLRKGSSYFTEEKYNLAKLASSSFRLTMVDLPVIVMSKKDVIGDTLYFCGIVENSIKQLRVIVYHVIKMQDRDNIFNQVTSSQEIETFVSLPSSTRSCINTSNFCFLSYSPDMTNVKMSAPIKITQWKQSDAPNDKKRKAQDGEPEETTEALFSRLVTTITQLQHDALFLKRLDDFMKRDAVKNAKIEEDTFIEKGMDMISSNIGTNNTSGNNNNNNNSSSNMKNATEHAHGGAKMQNVISRLLDDDDVN